MHPVSGCLSASVQPIHHNKAEDFTCKSKANSILVHHSGLFDALPVVNKTNSVFVRDYLGHELIHSRGSGEYLEQQDILSRINSNK